MVAVVKHGSYARALRIALHEFYGVDDLTRENYNNQDYGMLRIYIDADACPVKNEVFRVAGRYSLDVVLVSNSWMRIPDNPRISLEVVTDDPDAADDWIVKQVESGDIVITADILLAGRCLKKEARVLGTHGKPFTEDTIGDAIATRDLLSDLRDAGENTGGPPPLKKSDRSIFLQQLDQMIHAIRRANPA